jgi:hypothetical protein
MPTQRSGNARNSARVEVTRIGAGNFMSRTGPTIIYGRALELGGSHNARAFPALERALLDSLPELRALYKTSWAAAVRT